MSENKEELIALYYRNFPLTVREKSTVEHILRNPANLVLEHHENGQPVGALVLRGNTILMLAVDKDFRSRGIGSRLLSEAEKLTKNAGYDEIVCGVGEDYLTPGVPTGKKVYEEPLRGEAVYPDADDAAARFFQKRGYYHAEDNANIFDMRLDWEDYVSPPIRIGESYQGVHYRFADIHDKDAIRICTDDAEESFTKYYMRDMMYTSADRRVLVAEIGNEIVGTLMVEEEAEGEGLGSVGCTTVKNACRGRHIATMMVKLGTGYLKERGMKSAYLGYTYSGLDKLYGASGYHICIYYFMAHKKL